MKTATILKRIMIALLTAFFVSFTAYALLYYSPGVTAAADLWNDLLDRRIAKK